MSGEYRWYLVEWGEMFGEKHLRVIRGLSRDNNGLWLTAKAAGSREFCESAKRLLEMPW